MLDAKIFIRNIAKYIVINLINKLKYVFIKSFNHFENIPPLGFVIYAIIGIGAIICKNAILATLIPISITYDTNINKATIPQIVDIKYKYFICGFSLTNESNNVELVINVIIDPDSAASTPSL